MTQTKNTTREAAARWLVNETQRLCDRVVWCQASRASGDLDADLDALEEQRAVVESLLQREAAETKPVKALKTDVGGWPTCRATLEDRGVVEGGDVSAGEPGSEDYDEGVVLEITGDRALVAWQSGTRTEHPACDLRPGHEGAWADWERQALMLLRSAQTCGAAVDVAPLDPPAVGYRCTWSYRRIGRSDGVHRAEGATAAQAMAALLLRLRRGARA